MKRSKLFATVLMLVGLSATTTTFAQSDVTITDAARQHFNAGVAYIEDPAGAKYEEAYREFRLAYTASPSYKILNNLGLCALSLERDGEAIDAYEKFLAKATAEDIPQAKRELMQRDIATLKSSLVKITLTATPADVLITDERISSNGSTIINRYDLKGGKVALGLHPGHHRITAKAEGYEPQTWDIETDSASTHSHEFKLVAAGQSAAAASAQANLAVTTPPETQSGNGTSSMVYVGAVATGIFAVGATVTGLMYLSKKSDYQDANDGSNSSKANDLNDSAKTLGLITDIGIGAAVLSAGATAIFYFAGSSSKTTEKPASSAWQLNPTVSPHLAGLSVSGSF